MPPTKQIQTNIRLQRVKNILEAKGINPNSPIPKKGLNELRAKIKNDLTKKQGFEKEELEETKQGLDKLLVMREEINQQLSILKKIEIVKKEILSELKREEIRLSIIDSNLKKSDLNLKNEIKAIIKTINGVELRFNERVREIETKIIKEKKTGLEQIDSVNKLLATLNQRRIKEIKDIVRQIPKKHVDLEEVGIDDHHKAKHNLETHTESILMQKLERLISGEIVDDLHKHTIMKGKERIIDIAGITKNDFLQWMDDDPEDLSSQCDGATTAFTTANTIDAIVWVSLNGTNLILGVDYTKTGDKEITITTVTPDTGEELHIKYITT